VATAAAHLVSVEANQVTVMQAVNPSMGLALQKACHHFAILTKQKEIMFAQRPPNMRPAAANRDSRAKEAHLGATAASKGSAVLLLIIVPKAGKLTQ
jgi:hypothetical protein